MVGIYCEDYEIAFYPPGLWGDGTKEHLPIGWFDVNASGYYSRW